MTEIRMSVGDQVGSDDEAHLESILDSIRPNEKLILTMNRADAHEADELINILENRGFIIQPKGGHEDEYYLHCWKKEEK